MRKCMRACVRASYITVHLRSLTCARVPRINVDAVFRSSSTGKANIHHATSMICRHQLTNVSGQHKQLWQRECKCLLRAYALVLGNVKFNYLLRRVGVPATLAMSAG